MFSFIVRTNELEVSAAIGAHLHFSLSPSNSQTDSYRVTPDLFSVVEQKKAEKSDQYPEYRAENSEPEWDVPA